MAQSRPVSVMARGASLASAAAAHRPALTGAPPAARNRWHSARRGRIIAVQMHCPRCEHENAPGAAACAGCGAPLATTGPAGDADVTRLGFGTPSPARDADVTRLGLATPADQAALAGRPRGHSGAARRHAAAIPAAPPGTPVPHRADPPRRRRRRRPSRSR